jgi:hypothetical protein
MSIGRKGSLSSLQGYKYFVGRSCARFGRARGWFERDDDVARREVRGSHDAWKSRAARPRPAMIGFSNNSDRNAEK